MPAPPPAFYAVNVLDDAVLTLLPDGAIAGKGAARLVDRDLGLECEDAGTAGERTWHADRGLDAPDVWVDAWLFAGSGYAGVPLTLASSADGLGWTTRATVTPAADEPVRVPVAFVAPRFLKWTATDPPAPVRFTESMIAPAVIFRWKPAAGSMREPHALNVSLSYSVSGRGWAVQRGPRRWGTTFVMSAAPDTDRAKLYAFLTDLADTAKPFFVLTVTSELRWVRMLGPIEPAGVSKSPSGEWDLPVTLVEELP
jgi:hypothetical protein